MADQMDALTALLGPTLQRQQYQTPLFQAASNQAFMGLPTYARQGMSLSGSMPGVDLSGLSGGAGAGGNAAMALLAASPAFAKLIPVLQHLFGGGATDANTFVGPKLPPSDANTFVGPQLPFASGGSGGGPGTNAFNTIANLNASGIGGMFYGGPTGGGGVGYPGNQSGGIPDKIRGPKAF